MRWPKYTCSTWWSWPSEEMVVVLFPQTCHHKKTNILIFFMKQAWIAKRLCLWSGPRCHCPVRLVHYHSASHSPRTEVVTPEQSYHPPTPNAHPAPTLCAAWLHTLEKLGAWAMLRGWVPWRTRAAAQGFAALCLSAAIHFRPMPPPWKCCMSHHLWAHALH